MPLPVASRLGPYEIVGKLGEGGMGEVYRARDERLGRDVAVKVLPSHLSIDPAALARFEREARAVAALSHPNILSIFDVGQEAGVAYAVTELLEGETLRDRLRGGRLPTRKALEYAAQIARGLAAAHDKGIVHRDVKPENVFLTADGRAKLLDFGLAKPVAEVTGGNAYDATVVIATDPGLVAGTPPYMAPEQVRAQPVTPQTDIFSFGSLLFEMLTGRRAFHRASPVETMTAVLREDPPEVSEIEPSIPAPVAALVRHCLEKQPAERFQSAHDVAFQLQVLAGTPTPTPVPLSRAGVPAGQGADAPGNSTLRGADAPGTSALRGADTAGDSALRGADTAGDSALRGADAPGTSAVEVRLPQVWGEASASPREPQGSRHAKRARRLLALALAVPLLAAAAGSGWWFGHRPPAAPHFTRLSYTPKVIFRAAFAPEGDIALYSAAVDGNVPQVYQIGPEYPSSRLVGLPGSTHLLSVSPHGELAVLTDARVVTAEILLGTLARLPLGASAPRPVAEDVRDADWAGADGELAVIRGAGEKDRLECPPGRLLYETDGYLSDLHASPDGSRFAMFEHAMKWEDPASLIVVERTGRKSVLAGPYPFAHGMAWQRSGREVVFSASAHGEGNTSILAAGLNGAIRLVLEAPGNLTVHDVSATGRWLVSRDDRRLGVRGLAPGDASERELSWLDRSEASALSDDGRAVLMTEFAPPAGEAGAVCLRRTDGSPVVTLGDGIAQDLSPDGAWALALAGTSEQLVLYPTGAGARRTLPRGAIEHYRWASWFPDGKRILACGTERGKASRCYAQGVDGSAPRPVTPDGMWGLVSPDGARVLTWRGESSLVIYEIDRGGAVAAAAIPGITAEDTPVRWGRDGRTILVYRPRQLPGQIERVDLASGRREVLRQFAPADRVGLLSLDPVLATADASSYAYSYTRVLSTLFTVDGLR